MRRREFLAAIGAAAVARFPAPSPIGAGEDPPVPRAAALPRWRGFNLLEKFKGERNRPFRERDFEWMARWGLNFVRLPMDYTAWTDRARPRELHERVLKEIDQAVEWGRQHGIHVNLNLHRAPGYCVNPPAEKLDLWSSGEAVDLFAYQWRRLAERYRGLSSRHVSFDLLNEPKDMDESGYVKVMRQAIAAIREVDPARLILVDGLAWGRKPVMSLLGDRVAQSTRGYDPMEISHYRASWVGGSDRWPEPTWPLVRGGEVWDRERYHREKILPWKELEARGGGVHVGEWGAYNRTPHAVALAWMKDLLALWKEAGWGWALWNLRGSFGIVDSARRDVEYEGFEGHLLDRKMLELVRSDGAESS